MSENNTQIKNTTPILSLVCFLCDNDFGSYSYKSFCGRCENNEYDDEDDMEEYFQQEQQERELEYKAANCECGAWQISKNGEVFQVADCCCS
jgi:hypothetical protein